MTTKTGQMTKKLAALCLSAVLAVALLTGCGQAKEEQTTVRVGALKGPTSMGLLFLQEDAAGNKADGSYEFTMMTAADELLALIVKDELDIALLPANVAGVLYQKTNGGITVIDINTLGVLYMVSGDTSIDSVEKLKGRTVYLTGKGTTPDYVLQYVLKANGIAVGNADGGCMLEYKSEAAEVAAVLAENPEAAGLLPQPFVTAACVQNKALTTVLDMNAEWEAVQGEEGGRLVTGVTVVRNEFLQENEAAVRTFLKEHEKSVSRINEKPEEGARLAVEAGIVAKEPIALRAIPQCNITYIDGAQMKQALSGYLQALYDQNPEAVGGGMPGDDFYYE